MHACMHACMHASGACNSSRLEQQQDGQQGQQHQEQKQQSRRNMGNRGSRGSRGSSSNSSRDSISNIHSCCLATIISFISLHISTNKRQMSSEREMLMSAAAAVSDATLLTFDLWRLSTGSGSTGRSSPRINSAISRTTDRNIYYKSAWRIFKTIIIFSAPFSCNRF